MSQIKISEKFCKNLEGTINFDSVLPMFFNNNEEAKGKDNSRPVLYKENYMTSFKKVLADFNYKISQLNVRARQEARRHTVTILNQVLRYCQKQGLPFIVVKSVGFRLYGFTNDIDLRSKYIDENKKKLEAARKRLQVRKTLLLV